jgi:hypothetical protein
MARGCRSHPGEMGEHGWDRILATRVARPDLRSGRQHWEEVRTGAAGRLHRRDRPRPAAAGQCHPRRRRRCRPTCGHWGRMARHRGRCDRARRSGARNSSCREAHPPGTSPGVGQPSGCIPNARPCHSLPLAADRNLARPDPCATLHCPTFATGRGVVSRLESVNRPERVGASRRGPGAGILRIFAAYRKSMGNPGGAGGT